jgi:hypothetical protein
MISTETTDRVAVMAIIAGASEGGFSKSGLTPSGGFPAGTAHKSIGACII